MKSPHKSVAKEKPGVNLEDVLLHQDNTPAHTAQTSMLEIGLLVFELMDHTSYSPDRAQMDFLMFPVVKSALKGYRFDSFL